ncbi:MULTISPECIES: hypothetical protein [Sanguibacteroides]|uniref:Uncharacterized protein n=1 Tax=Sanguibacteroides justesenii TaxID=1547597 RepID=A0A0C3NA77_9PORP|nr:MULTISPECIES: hypothetical protein [Sanguibacteroides]KIO42947.1 hypothetical protein BA92_13905 [Sanguibacteroides justesenii]PXZ44268.1 hypothetical protein DMB45_06355 [Sanguibacteroides justesenii]
MKREISEVIIGWMLIFQLEGLRKVSGLFFPKRESVDQVSRRSGVVVIFDELFRGTNVKDVYDGTSVLTKAFDRNTKNAGEDLKKDCANVNFVYFRPGGKVTSLCCLTG